jgi:homoserine kinase
VTRAAEASGVARPSGAAEAVAVADGPRAVEVGRRVRVRVPATSANLGPGFDAFGLALGLHDEVEVAVTTSGLSVDAIGPDAVAQDETHLVVRAIRATFELLGWSQPGLALRCVNRIPHGRGLGSSAAAIVAGVAAAWVLDPAAFLGPAAGFAGSPGPTGLLGAAGTFDRSAALRVATALEGHPDNVAAALFGGFTVAWSGPDGVLVHRAEPVTELRPVAFVPSGRTSTADSRGRLPERVTHADAAFSAGRAGLLALALTLPVDAQDRSRDQGARPGGSPQAAAERARLLLAATEDRLHQPYRLPAAPESAALAARLREAGVATVLSGSGPTVLALALGAGQAATAVGVAAPGFAVLPLAVDRDGVQVGSIGGR